MKDVDSALKAMASLSHWEEKNTRFLEHHVALLKSTILNAIRRKYQAPYLIFIL